MLLTSEDTPRKGAEYHIRDDLTGPVEGECRVREQAADCGRGAGRTRSGTCHAAGRPLDVYGDAGEGVPHR
jgi:hypothetical protein